MEPVRIATWNVNSVKQRVPRLLPWLDARYPPQFRLVQVEDEPGHKDELRLSLSRALKLSGLPHVATERMPLPDLVQAALNRRKGTWLP